MSETTYCDATVHHAGEPPMACGLERPCPESGHEQAQRAPRRDIRDAAGHYWADHEIHP
jgi:hypothetical protein